MQISLLGIYTSFASLHILCYGNDRFDRKSFYALNFFFLLLRFFSFIIKLAWVFFFFPLFCFFNFESIFVPFPNFTSLPLSLSLYYLQQYVFTDGQFCQTRWCLVFDLFIFSCISCMYLFYFFLFSAVQTFDWHDTVFRCIFDLYVYLFVYFFSCFLRSRLLLRDNLSLF